MSEGETTTTIRPLTPADILAATKYHPELKNYSVPEDAGSVVEISTATHHIVFALGETHILHALPFSANNEKSFERDRALTTYLRGHVKPGIIAIPSQAFRIGDWVCTIQDRLRGVPLDEFGASGGTANTRSDFLDILGALKAMPYADGMELLYYEHERPNLRKRTAKAVRQWSELQQIGYAVDPQGRVREVLQSSLSAISDDAEYPLHRPVVLHADFRMQNVLVDQIDGSITGVIDWSEAMMGDPCEDVAGVALCLGEKAARRVANEVGYDNGTSAKGMLFAKCISVDELWGLKLGGGRQPVERPLWNQFWLMFEDLRAHVKFIEENGRDGTSVAQG